MTERSDDNLQFQAATLEWIDRFAPYGVIATDRNFQVRTWNYWMEQHSGLAANSVIGRSLLELYPDLAQRRTLGQLERALEGEVSVVSTALHGHLIPLPPAAGEVRFPFMKQTARIAPLSNRGEILGVLIVIEDVSQREWQTDILRRQHARDEVLAWALAYLMKAEDPRRVMREVFCKVAEHLDFDSYLLHILHPETASLQLHAAGGIDPAQEQNIRTLSPSDIPWLGAAQEGHAVVREHVLSSTDPQLAKAQELGFHAYIVLPLITGSTLLGLLCFGTRIRKTIAQNETELLTTLGQYLAVALNREKTDRELRIAQQKLNDHAHELENSVAERTASLKQIIAELQTFSYTIAHDLRAPIRAVSGYCEVLVEDYADHLPAEAAAVVRRLLKASIQMDALTRDLLEFSKVSRQDFTLEPVDLSRIVKETISLGGLRFSSVTTVQFPLHSVIANATLVGQCVSNLLENAVKFIKPGIPPTVRIWSEVIPLPAPYDPPRNSNFSRSRYSLAEPGPIPSLTSPRVRLWVEDTGVGVSPGAQTKIFGIFERGDLAAHYEGTGIGLAIVARAMERMGGRCGVDSVPDQGSRFWLEFQSAPISI